MEEKIKGRFIIQIAGKPVENVEKALNVVLDKLKSEKENFKVLDSDIAEPELDEESSLYSGFIDIELRFSDISKLFGFIIDYTPNSIEIEDPEKITFTNSDLSNILNDVSHIVLGTQMQLRNLNAQVHMLNKKLEDKK